MNRSRPDADSLATEAMNRVLESERRAEATIAECERRCSEQLEQARAQRRAILERAQARTVALHTRAARALQKRSAQIMEEGRKAAAGVGADDAPERREAALQQLISQLIAPEPPPRNDDG